MTPAQKTALESLVGRELTAGEVININPLLAHDSRNDVAVAAILSTGRTRAKVREIGNGTIIEVLGLATGNAVLDEIGTNQVFRHVKPLLEQGRLLIGMPLVQETVQSFVAGGLLTQAQSDALRALGREPEPIDFNKVSDVLNVAEGRMTL